MKSIKGFDKFFEHTAVAPQLERGTVLIFSDENHDDDFMKKISKKIGYEYLGQADNSGAYIIKTPIGEEEEVGNMFKEKYPEFFTGYERRDLRWEKSEENRTELKEDIDQLIDGYFSYADKRRFINKFEFNSDIDNIIKKLNDLKL